MSDNGKLLSLPHHAAGFFMSTVDNIRLLGVASRELARLGLDALSDVSGTALPYSQQRVCTPEVLQGWCNTWPVPGVLSQPVALDEVAVQNVPAVSSNCQNLTFSLQQSGPRVLPDSVFVKVPMESMATRWFLSVINSWKLESHFFRHVARDVPLRTPVTYATHWQGTRFFLVQENLRDDPAVELFTNIDMHEGPSLSDVRLCLDAFARLHARHYGLPAREREQLLPLDFHPFLSPSMGVVSQALNRLALAPCMKKQPGVIPQDIADAYRATLANWDALLRHWFSGPLSLLHGDSHLGNFFRSGAEMGMLDWQAAHWGKGIRDVQYFLIDSLHAQVLAANEQDLVAYYVERRAHYGEAVDVNVTWQEYRSFTFHTLMTIVVCIGFGALNEEQDLLMREILHRAVAAVDRVDYPGWLEAFLSA